MAECGGGGGGFAADIGESRSAPVNVEPFERMSSMNYDLLLTACQHHHDLAKHAADLHLVDRPPGPPSI